MPPKKTKKSKKSKAPKQGGYGGRNAPQQKQKQAVSVEVNVNSKNNRRRVPVAGGTMRFPYLPTTTSIINHNMPIPSYFEVPRTNADTQIKEFTRSFKAELDEALKMYWGVNPDGLGLQQPPQPAPGPAEAPAPAPPAPTEREASPPGASGGGGAGPSTGERAPGSDEDDGTPLRRPRQGRGQAHAQNIGILRPEQRQDPASMREHLDASRRGFQDLLNTVRNARPFGPEPRPPGASGGERAPGSDVEMGEDDGTPQRRPRQGRGQAHAQNIGILRPEQRQEPTSMREHLDASRRTFQRFYDC